MEQCILDEQCMLQWTPETLLPCVYSGLHKPRSTTAMM
jgi:hypothetical protein